MTVELTSPVLGQAVGSTHTGPLEDWLLASGYAKRAGYTGAGVSNTGTSDILPANDPQLPANRSDKAHWPGEASSKHNATIANTAAGLTATKFPNPDTFDFDPAGVDNDAPSNVVLAPVTGALAGGTVVTITGDNLAGVTSVTFGGVAGTALNVTAATAGKAGTITVTTPAGTAGAKNVVLVDPSGSATVVNGFTYA